MKKRNVLFAILPTLFVLLLIFSSTSAQRAQSPLFAQTDLFQQGEGGVHTYRIPALAVTRKGTLLAVADARHESPEDLPGVIDLVMRRSTDLGKTWEPITVIRNPPGRAGAGDPSLLLDRRTGRVFCFYAYGPPGVGFFHSQPCNAAADNCLHAQFIYSDDAGKTWRMGQRAGTNVNESKVIEMPDGTVRQDIRHNNGTDDLQIRFLAISRDGGVTFGPMKPAPNLIDPWVNADILRYDAKRAILFSNPADARQRLRLTVRASFDQARTWPLARVVHEGPAAYSTMAVLPDGTIGLLYERGDKSPYEKISFARFNREWLKSTP